MNLKQTLFICAGNIFRSPFASMYFSNRAVDKNLGYKAFSRGTDLYFDKPHPIVVEVAKQFDVDLANHEVSMLSKHDIDLATAIICFKDSHLDQVLDIDPKCIHKTFLISDLSNQDKREFDDFDYHLVDSNPEIVYKSFSSIVRAIDKLLEQ